uniref:transmembrane protein 150A-like isoform X2 n=1 Tax=Myxine glutinosa TaxID=7769 RepID=UPI00358E53DA
MTGLASWFLEDLGQKTFSGPPHEGESEIQMLSWVLLPICFPVFAIIGIWIAYGMAVYYQHVCPLNNWSYNISCPAVEPDARFGPKSCCTIQDIPLVSKCGAYPPESCLFSLVGNLGSFMVLWICSLRYCQLVEQQQQSWLNRLALGAGSVSAVGLIAVSNFQVDSVKVLHYVGASVAFLAVTFYLCLQTVLTYRTAGLLGYNWLGHARSFFTLMATVTLILSILTALPIVKMTKLGPSLPVEHFLVKMTAGCSTPLPSVNGPSRLLYLASLACLASISVSFPVLPCSCSCPQWHAYRRTLRSRTRSRPLPTQLGNPSFRPLRCMGEFFPKVGSSYLQPQPYDR